MALGRRELLVIGGGIVCAKAIGCGGVESATLPSTIDAGSASAVPASSLRAVGNAPVAIGRDGGGIYALSLVCTHQGCDIGSGTVSFDLLQCPCHGSQFNGQGNVLRGPATAPLSHLLVTADATGALTIHGDTPVSATTRLSI